MSNLKIIFVVAWLCGISAVLGYALAPEPITHMDCSWEAWEQRSVTIETDYRERAVAECVKFTIDKGSPETCELSRYESGEWLIESNLDMAELVLEFLYNMAGAGQCIALDGSYYTDLGGWNFEAIEAQEILIYWMQQEEWQSD